MSSMGRAYAARRNYDFGPQDRSNISCLSAHVRHRLVLEAELAQTALAAHGYQAAEKFIQEVCWRTYWKGWLEMRPTVWSEYNVTLRQRLNDVQTQSGFSDQWAAACKGETDIDCFNAWAQELVETGYLHNHARMWFASIWIFTLRLPWELGADFFLRHLLDGDPASNTLGWRWVAGIQTPGKTYLARTSNISKFTEGRFAPKWQLAGEAVALDAPPAPSRMALPDPTYPEPSARTGLILHDEDLSPGFVLDAGLTPVATAVVSTRHALSPLTIAPHVSEFARLAAHDTVSRFGDRLGAVTQVTGDPASLADWAREAGVEQIVTPYAPVGPTADLFTSSRAELPPLHHIRRAYDSRAWPHATHGFFRFKDKIPNLLANMRGLSVAE